MIAEIIKQLQADEWYNVSAQVEIAKGRDEYLDTFTKMRRALRRIFNSKYYGKAV